ncbi:MAG TPA: DNA recombination protein RmuC [Bacteroidales bacterium]|nr:DNA recombination protein RmuC [Bacteroidales bacterium]
MTATIILSIALSFIAGIVLTWIVFNNKISKAKQDIALKETQLIKKDADIANLTSRLEDNIGNLNKSLDSAMQELSEEREFKLNLTSKLSRSEEQNKALNEKLDSQKAEIENIQKKFTAEFENLANRILKQNTLDFTAANQKNISDILNPLKEKLSTFEKQVDETYKNTLRDQTDLKAELKKLQDLNVNISEEARNLTKALKGDTKKQGNWGEIVLERILERSGLVKGEEYETQFTARNDHGEIIRPDVLVKLPDNKHIIIDSKVSLIAYERFVNADTSEEKERFARLHIESIKNHIKGLSDKSYSHSSDLNSPDFVLMFLPIESSFSMAIQQDIELFNYAWDKRVVMVSPSTLLATLRTIESIWKHEKQTQNAIEIATEGGKLYDKFVGLVEDLKKLGAQIDTVQKTFQEANKKLHTGSGNLIGKVDKLRQLGAKNTKNLPLLFNNDNELTENSESI